MNLRNTFSAIIPVESHTQQRSEPVAPVPVPQSGANIGRPSAFSFSLAGARGPGGGEGSGPKVVVDLPDQGPVEYIRIIPARAHVLMQEVRIEDPDQPGAHVDVERYHRLRFSFTEYPPKPYLRSLQPVVLMTYDLRFDLHPEAEAKLSETDLEAEVGR